MADRYLCPNGGSWDTGGADVIWAATSDTAPDGGIAAGDTAILDEFSGALTIALNGSVACGGMDATGYEHEITFVGGNVMDINGDGILPEITGSGSTIYAGGSLELVGDIGQFVKVTFDGTGNHTVTSNGFTFGWVNLSNNGVTDLVAQDAHRSLKFTGDGFSKYSPNGFNHTVSGDIDITGDTIGNNATTWRMIADGTFSNTSGFGNNIKISVGPGVTMTVPHTTVVKKVTLESSTSVITGGSFFLFAVDGDGWWDQSISSMVNTALYCYDTTNAPGTDISTTQNIYVYAIDKVLSLDANIISTGSILVYGLNDNTTMRLNMNGYSMRVNILSIGNTSGTNRQGYVDLGSAGHNINIIKRTSAGNGGALALNSSQITMNSNFDGEDITVLCDDDACHFISSDGNGRFRTVAIDGGSGKIVHSHDCTVEGDCDGITDNTEAYPNLKATAMVG